MMNIRGFHSIGHAVRCSFAINGQRSLTAAFSRVDLITLVGMSVIGMGWLGFLNTGERGRSANCGRQLSLLNQLAEAYMSDHGGKLPPASVESSSVSWDLLLIPYIPKNKVTAGIDPFFRCPSDQVDRSRPRSYALSAHDMKPKNWPVDANTQTGLGLTWNANSIGSLLGDTVAKAGPTDSRSMGLIALANLPDPSDTLLFADLPHRENNLKQLERTTVGSPGEQLESLEGGGGIHLGRFNYLMADGHIQLLSPLQTGSSGGIDIEGHHGIWTIKAGD